MLTILVLVLPLFVETLGLPLENNETEQLRVYPKTGAYSMRSSMNQICEAIRKDMSSGCVCKEDKIDSTCKCEEEIKECVQVRGEKSDDNKAEETCLCCTTTTCSSENILNKTNFQPGNIFRDILGDSFLEKMQDIKKPFAPNPIFSEFPPFPKIPKMENFPMAIPDFDLDSALDGLGFSLKLPELDAGVLSDLPANSSHMMLQSSRLSTVCSPVFANETDTCSCDATSGKDLATEIATKKKGDIGSPGNGDPEDCECTAKASKCEDGVCMCCVSNKCSSIEQSGGVKIRK